MFRRLMDDLNPFNCAEHLVMDQAIKSLEATAICKVLGHGTPVQVTFTLYTPQLIRSYIFFY